MATFNPSDNTWSNFADPKDDFFPMGSYLGEAILKKLAEYDPERVAEYNHDTNEVVTMKDIYERTIAVAENLKDLLKGPDDVVAFYSRHNSYISSITFGCYLNGNPFSAFDTFDQGKILLLIRLFNQYSSFV